MYRRNLKAIIVAFVLVSGFGIGTAAHVSAADTMSPQGAAQSKSVNQNVATGTKVVTGTVTDPSGETLIGLTVKVSGTNVAVATDLDGNYSIKVPAGSNELEFSYIGYQTIKQRYQTGEQDRCSYAGQFRGARRSRCNRHGYHP